MAEPLVPDVVVNICQHCIPDGARLPRQWKVHNPTGEAVGSEALVVTRELPCAGKLDVQYLVRAFEGLAAGVCVVACSEGACQHIEGSDRAEARVETVRRLLAEVGLEPGRVELCRVSPNDAHASFEQAVHASVKTLCALGPSPLRSVSSNPVPSAPTPEPTESS